MLTLCFLAETAQDREHGKVNETLNEASEGSMFNARNTTSKQEISWLLATSLASWRIMHSDYSVKLHQIRVSAGYRIGQTAEQGLLDKQPRSCHLLAQSSNNCTEIKKNRITLQLEFKQMEA